MMEMRLCTSCKNRCWHNSGKRDGGEARMRCTFCGYPVTTTQEQKSSYQRDLLKRQVSRANTLR